MRKVKKEKFETLKNVFYAVKIIKACCPWYFTVQILATGGFWFFTAFVQEILFLRVILQVLEKSLPFKAFVIAVVMFVASGIIARIIQSYSNYVLSVKFKQFYKTLNEKIFEKAISVDIACFEDPVFFDKYKRATEIISESHYDMFIYYFSSIFVAAFTGIFIVAYVISIDPKILLVLLCMLPVLAAQALKGKLSVKKDKEMTVHKRSKAYVKRVIYLKEYSKDMRTSDVFRVLHKRFSDAVEKNREIIKKYGWKIAFYEVMSGFFGQALPVAVTYAYATYRYAFKRNLALADFSVIMTAMGNIRDVINDMGEAISVVKNESLYFGNLKEFFDYEPHVVSGTLEPDELEILEFKNVSFTYPHLKEPTLKNLNLVFRKGETTAIVGENGAGKTTFVKLLLRFYDPDEGEILYNGRNLREYDIDALRKRFGNVFQDYKVFAVSVAENVICKELECESEWQRVSASLKNSGADSFVKHLPQEDKTVISREFDETGVGLSGGEQQKIAAARMFCKNFDLAILDEPSSALDPVAEYNMYKNLVCATREKTVVYISHRLSSAMLSDKIYVFEDGSVIESGTHDELMQVNGKYAEMFTLQASNYRGNEGSVTAE